MTNISFVQHLSPEKREKLLGTLTLCEYRQQNHGVHSSISMEAAGLYYTGNDDAVQCQKCGLEVSGWTIDMKPFTIHAERSPQCPFVCSMRPDRTMSISTPINSLTTASTTDENEIPTKRQKIEPIEEISQPNILVEVSMMKSIRRRTFSHWPHHISPSSAQMIAAGFFNCNTGDRVICIYCNLICQEWKANKDDPFETHRTRSPRCPYVLAQLKKQQTASIHIINEQSTGDERFQCIEIVYTAACHQAYVEIPRRHASFETWPNENLPSVDDLVRAGFFYAGTKTIVTCFYCNGSLQNWGAKDNPMIEHARWFPHCAYIKQLCGPEFYQRIQESKRAYQERNTSASATKESEQNNLRTSREILITTAPEDTRRGFSSDIPNKKSTTLCENLLPKHRELYLPLPMSQTSTIVNYPSPLIRQCREEQILTAKKDRCLERELEVTWTSSFKEKREETIKRANSFHPWSFLKPSRLLVFLAGWMLISSGKTYLTQCTHCNEKYDNWQPNDDPFIIHQKRSPYCPYVRSLNPIVRDRLNKRDACDVYIPDVVAVEIAQYKSNVILNRTSRLAEPPTRTQSFSKFPIELAENVIDILVKCGFYYTRTGTKLQCYHCRGIVDDFHQISTDKIYAKHLERFPHCRFAQLLPKSDELRPNNDKGICEWCMKNPRKLVVYPCNCFAVCLSCAQLTGTCPRCGSHGETFFKLFE